jgi:hypothetical protein
VQKHLEIGGVSMSKVDTGTGRKGQKLFKNARLKKEEHCSKESSVGVDVFRGSLLFSL